MKKFAIKKLLVPTDFSETASKALSQAVFLAKMNGAHIKLVHVISPFFITGSELTVPYSHDFFNKLYTTATSHLKKIIEKIKEKNKIDISFDVKMGSIEVVVNYIAKKEKIDLIIMGTHGTSGIKEFFAGSNAYKVVHYAPCPVITLQKKTKAGFKNIILSVRPHQFSKQKIEPIIELAGIFGSTVHVVGFTSDKKNPVKNKLKQTVSETQKYLSSLNINYTSTLIFKDNFIKEILDHAAKKNGDLLAFMNDYSFSPDQIIKGPYAKQLVNHSKIPVLNIPETNSPK